MNAKAWLLAATLGLGSAGAAAAQSGSPVDMARLTDGNRVVRAKELRRLEHLRPSKREGLATTLRTFVEAESDPELRSRAFDLLVRFSSTKPTLQLLLSALADPTASVQSSASHALSRLGERAAPVLPELLELLRSGDWDRARFAIPPLVQLRSRRAEIVPVLLTRLRATKRTPPILAGPLLEALAYLSPRGPVVEELLKGAQSPSQRVRASAVSGLGWLTGRDALRGTPWIIAALVGKDDYVRGRGVEALRRLGPRAGPEAAALMRVWLKTGTRTITAAGLLGALGETADDAVPDLIAALSDRRDRVRLTACESLGRLRAQGAVEAIVGLVRSDPRGAVRVVALRALGRIRAGTRRIPQPVLDATRDPSCRTIRATACIAAGRIGGPKVEAAMIGALRDREATVRVAAVTSLGRLRPRRANTSFVAATHDPADAVREAAIAALVHVREPSAGLADHVAAALTDRRVAVRRAAIRTLVRLRHATPVVMKALGKSLRDDPDPKAREAARAAKRRLEEIGK